MTSKGTTNKGTPMNFLNKRTWNTGIRLMLEGKFYLTWTITGRTIPLAAQGTLFPYNDKLIREGT